MKKKIIFLSLSLIACYTTSSAQVQFWSDTFEDTGAPTSGTRTPENNTGTGSPFTSYFVRTNNTGISVVTSAGGGYLSGEGAKFWAGEDHDGITGVTVAGTEEQQIDWTGINISGKSNLSFRGLFAANNTTAAFENTNFNGASHNDYVIVEYRIDGGAYQPLLRFYANNGTTTGVNNKSLAIDTNNDGIGDGTILTSTFQEIQATIIGTGTTLDFRIKAFMNGGSEEWAIDNFRLLEGVLSTNDLEANKSFTMYPNPNKGDFINFETPFSGKFEIINQLGQTVKSFEVTANTSKTISLETLTNGLYFIKGVNGTTITTQKLMIKK